MESLDLAQEQSVEAFTDESDLNAIFIQQKECFAREPYVDYKHRIKSLKSLYKILIDNQDAICAAVSKDFGCRPEYETKVLEIFTCLESIKYTLKHLKKWMRPQSRLVSKWFLPSKSYIMAQPKGVVGIISPWNYPLMLVIVPLAAAIAAGNRVMIKLSEHTPHLSKLLNDLLSQIFLPTKLAVVLGDSKLSSEFSKLPFDHLFFTGSTAVGKKVYAAASVNLTPVTLELGGKCPAVLVEHEIKQEYIDRIWLGKIINSGQTCIAPDYIWLPKGEINKLLELTNKVAKSRFVDLNSSDYCSIINKQNYTRILDLIKEAESKGAIWQPFCQSWHTSENNIYKISPGLLLNCNHNMAIMQQEVFGPVLPVMEYDTFDELVSIMEVVPRPLAVYLFTQDKAKQRKFYTHSISGALTINTTILHAAQENLPFGGVGDSGMGRYRGKYGFETFSMLKPIFIQSKLDIFSKFYPPKKKWQKLLLNFMLK